MRIPHCEFGDKIFISRLCAHFGFELDEIVEIYTVSSSESSFSDKIHYFRLKHPIISDHENMSDRKQAQKLAFLLSDLFYSVKNPNEQLLLASKVLKLSLKQIFQLCSPELFYRLLIAGGRLSKNGEDLSKVPTFI